MPGIVVGIGGSSSNDLALDWAVDEATRRHLPLTLLSCWGSSDEEADTRPGDLRTSRDDCLGVLRTARERVTTTTPGLAVRVEARHGPADAALVVASAGADLVVVGSRGRAGLLGALAGSTSVHVASHAACPVVVVRQLARATPTLPRVIVGVDGSAASLEAIGFAFGQASQRNVGLTVVHAWDVELIPGLVARATPMDLWSRLGEDERAVTSESISGWSARCPDVSMRIHVLRGRAVDVLVTHSRGAELLVVGSRGHDGLGGLLLGSVSLAVLHRAHCPVAVIRPQT